MNRRTESWITASLLLALFTAQVMSARLKSPTYDEQAYMTAGYAFVRLHDLHILVGEPILLGALEALPLLALPDLHLPIDHPSWAGTNFHPIAEQFLWYANDNTDQILFLSRLPMMLLTLLLAAFVYRWARDAFGPWAGMLSLILCTFDPNLIAHGRLATTDLGSTTFIFIATYWLWRLLRKPTWATCIASGVFFGLAQAARFSALLFAPGYALIFLWRAWSAEPFVPPFARTAKIAQTWQQRLAWLALTGIGVVLIGYLTMWAVYGFQIGPVSGQTTFPVPAPAYFDQLFYISDRLSGTKDPVTAFLLGELYVGGKWQYFPVAFLLKTPLPTLLLFGCAVVLAVWRSVRAKPSGRRIGRYPAALSSALWLPPLLYFLITLNSKLNLGYRYLLPVVPFVIVAAGKTGQAAISAISHLTGHRRALALAVANLLIGWTMWSGLSIYPHYLAFFNELAGGPDNGWHYLVDSNLDWGQDLKLLKRWLDEHGVGTIKLAYYGEGVPSYYGIDFEPQTCSPDRWQHPLHHDLYSADPAPGIYAISANLLQGRNLADPDTYAWFREREPIDKVGYSIFLYDVPARGERQMTLALSGLVPNDIHVEDYAAIGTNDTHVMWFDPAYAMIFPAQDTILMIAGETNVHPALIHLWPWQDGYGLSTARNTTTRDGRPLQIWEGDARDLLAAHLDTLAPLSPVWHLAANQFAPGDPAANGDALGLPVAFGDKVALLAYALSGTTLRPGDTLTAVTYWQILDENGKPLKLFVHLLDQNGVYSGGQDRLDVWYENWRPGDQFAQVQEIVLAPGAKPGDYQVEIGWYYPGTMARLPVIRGDTMADRVLLKAISVDD